MGRDHRTMWRDHRTRPWAGRDDRMAVRAQRDAQRTAPRVARSRRGVARTLAPRAVAHEAVLILERRLAQPRGRAQIGVAVAELLARAHVARGAHVQPCASHVGEHAIGLTRVVEDGGARVEAHANDRRRALERGRVLHVLVRRDGDHVDAQIAEQRRDTAGVHARRQPAVSARCKLAKLRVVRRRRPGRDGIKQTVLKGGVGGVALRGTARGRGAFVPAPQAAHGQQ